MAGGTTVKLKTWLSKIDIVSDFGKCHHTPFVIRAYEHSPGATFMTRDVRYLKSP